MANRYPLINESDYDGGVYLDMSLSFVERYKKKITDKTDGMALDEIGVYTNAVYQTIKRASYRLAIMEESTASPERKKHWQNFVTKLSFIAEQLDNHIIDKALANDEIYRQELPYLMRPDQLRRDNGSRFQLEQV